MLTTMNIGNIDGQLTKTCHGKLSLRRIPKDIWQHSNKQPVSIGSFSIDLLFNE